MAEAISAIANPTQKIRILAVNQPYQFKGLISIPREDKIDPFSLKR
jgi:hypothetical protein